MADEQSITDIAARHQLFSAEAAGLSVNYEIFARSIADDPAVLQLLATLPPAKAQPNLLLAAVQYRHGAADTYLQLRSWIIDDWDQVAATMMARATQTNEPARCAAILPLLALIPGPITLIEVGASAGLCLYPDRYSYSYDGRRFGPRSSVLLQSTTTGPFPMPTEMPQIVKRVGIDLNPLDPSDADDRAWLQALIWPGEDPRRSRLTAALDLAAGSPAEMMTGDLIAELPGAVSRATPGSTVVAFHTAVLAYLDAPRRAVFADLVRQLPIRWISQEGLGVFPAIRDQLPHQGADSGQLVLALDGKPLARTAPHGGRIDWLQQR
ncbi:hypothetical protein ABIB25_005097 [Nakamurella sp. UYEF19]|uniref:DUF2332 domain-containing protein n=1 Tax=Nakamurella sp. UYEF19 TaxID=1756392 RepID=UPI003392C731